MSETPSYLTIVSGLPRSGTSMMMRMLEAGGIGVITDQQREADEDNPKGYYEFEPAKQTKDDPSWLNDTAGQVVKMVYKLLYDLPDTHQYRVLLMRRDLQEVLASQKVMLGRMGKADDVPDAVMENFFRAEIEKFSDWIVHQPAFQVLEVSYNDLLTDPEPSVRSIASFLQRPLDTLAMCQVVDKSLYRNRSAS